MCQRLTSAHGSSQEVCPWTRRGRDGRSPFEGLALSAPGSGRCPGLLGVTWARGSLGLKVTQHLRRSMEEAEEGDVLNAAGSSSSLEAAFAFKWRSGSL